MNELENNRITRYLMLYAETAETVDVQTNYRAIIEKCKLNKEEEEALERFLSLGFASMTEGFFTPRTIFVAILEMGYALGREQGLLDA